jgi:HlyD family secretion protein
VNTQPAASPAKTAAASIAPAPAARRSRKPGAWRKWIPYGIGALIFLAIVNGLIPKPIEVETAVVANGPLTVAVLEEGKTRIRRRYVVSPPVTGMLNRVDLRAGDRIEAGQTVLASLRPQPASFLDPRAVAETEARVQAAEATQSRRDADLQRARASLELSRKELARADELKRRGALSERDWDAADAQVTVLTREVRGAEFGLRVAEFELAQARAALLQAEIGPDAPTALKSEPLKIVAPVSGYVLNVYEESARLLTAGTPIMEVGDPTDLEAEIELLSSDAVGVRPGAEVSIEQWGGEKSLRGSVVLIEPGGYTKISALGVEEQRVKVRVALSEPLPPGRTLGDRFRVEARIVTWTGKDVLQVPTGALFRRGGDWMTFALEGGKARLTKVEIAHNNGAAAEVRGGLRRGQTVILHSPDQVADGAAVRAMKSAH